MQQLQYKYNQHQVSQISDICRILIDGITFKVPNLFETYDVRLTKPYTISKLFSNNQPAAISHQ